MALVVVRVGVAEVVKMVVVAVGALVVMGAVWAAEIVVVVVEMVRVAVAAAGSSAHALLMMACSLAATSLNGRVECLTPSPAVRGQLPPICIAICRAQGLSRRRGSKRERERLSHEERER